MDEIDIRCPEYPRRLFLKVAPQVGDETLLQVACRDCRDRSRREGRWVAIVVHVFNVQGEHVETVLL